MPPQNHPVTLLRQPAMAVCHQHGDATLNLLLECGGIVADVDLLFTPPTFAIKAIGWGRVVRPV